jgi:hypothetical protein
MKCHNSHYSCGGNTSAVIMFVKKCILVLIDRRHLILHRYMEIEVPIYLIITQILFLVLLVRCTPTCCPVLWWSSHHGQISK